MSAEPPRSTPVSSSSYMTNKMSRDGQNQANSRSIPRARLRFPSMVSSPTSSSTSVEPSIATRVSLRSAWTTFPSSSHPVVCPHLEPPSVVAWLCYRCRSGNQMPAALLPNAGGSAASSGACYIRPYQRPVALLQAAAAPATSGHRRCYKWRRCPLLSSVGGATIVVDTSEVSHRSRPTCALLPWVAGDAALGLGGFAAYE
jgi:hypothetical protein